MTQRSIADLLSAGLFAMVQLAPAPASSQPSDSAAAEPLMPGASATDNGQAVKDLMRDGVRAFRANDFETARQSFEKAWQLSGHAAVAASLAEVEMKLGRFLAAERHWSYALENLPPERSGELGDIEKQRAECRLHLAALEVSVDTEGAAIFVDGARVGTAPLRNTIWLEPGRHSLFARIEGRISPEVVVAMSAHETRQAELRIPVHSSPREVRANPAAPAPTPIRDAPREKSSGLPVRSVVLLSTSAATIVAVSVGTVFALKAHGTAGRADAMGVAIDQADPEAAKRDAACSQPTSGRRPPTCDELHDLRRKYDAEANIATAAFIGGGVLALGTVATYFLWRSDDPGKPRSTGPAFRVTPWANSRGVGALFVLEGAP